MVALNKKVNASSLLEVIVAMVVIMVVFGIAMMIFTNVTRSSLSSKKMQAVHLVNDVLIRARLKRVVNDGELEEAGFKISIVREQGARPGLLTLTVTATDQNGQEIAKATELIPEEHE